jgi:hypothetical protein
MTQPNPAEAEAKTKAEAVKNRPQRGSVVGYRHRDPVTGGQLSGVGVVLVSDAGGYVVAPVLVDLPVNVEPGDVSPVDVAGSGD